MMNSPGRTTSCLRSGPRPSMRSRSSCVPSVPNGAGGFATDVCDPTKGFGFTQQTKDNFGKINLLRGHRVIEFVLKYYF